MVGVVLGSWVSSRRLFMMAAVMFLGEPLKSLFSVIEFEREEFAYKYVFFTLIFVLQGDSDDSYAQRGTVHLIVFLFILLLLTQPSWVFSRDTGLASYLQNIKTSKSIVNCHFFFFFLFCVEQPINYVEYVY